MCTNVPRIYAGGMFRNENRENVAFGLGLRFRSELIPVGFYRNRNGMDRNYRNSDRNVHLSAVSGIDSSVNVPIFPSVNLF